MDNIMIGPECECHNIPKVWKVDNRRKPGGYWECLIKRRETRKRSQHKYRHTAKGFMRDYLTKRERNLRLARIKTIEELEDIRKQLKELGLEPR